MIKLAVLSMPHDSPEVFGEPNGRSQLTLTGDDAGDFAVLYALVGCLIDGRLDAARLAALAEDIEAGEVPAPPDVADMIREAEERERERRWRRSAGLDDETGD